MLNKNFEFFSLYLPRILISVHKKFQLIRSTRLAGFMEYIYACLVLLYRLRNKTTPLPTPLVGHHEITLLYEAVTNLAVSVQVSV